MKRWFVGAGIVFIIVLVAIQFVPIERKNPLVESDMPAQEELKTVLKRS